MDFIWSFLLVYKIGHNLVCKIISPYRNFENKVKLVRLVALGALSHAATENRREFKVGKLLRQIITDCL